LAAVIEDAVLTMGKGESSLFFIHQTEVEGTEYMKEKEHVIFAVRKPNHACIHSMHVYT